MYCRYCGNVIEDNAKVCRECQTVVGEGVDYCNICGNETYEKQDHCRNCGAKLTNIVPLFEKKNRISELCSKAKKTKKQIKIVRVTGLIGLLVAIGLFAFAVLRKAPDNIPELSTIRILHEGYMEVITPEQKVRTASMDVQEYWALNRELLSYSVGLLAWFFYSLFITKILKKQYKKTLIIIKEEKECIAEHVETK